MNYISKITGFGDMALDFLGENMLIVFNEGAPPELAEISVLHTKAEVEKDIEVGDEIILGDKTYTVSAIGGEANYTFKTMGHCCLMFNGKDETELPGQIELKGNGLPELKINDKFEINYKVR